MSGSELWCFRVIFMAMHGLMSCEVQSVLVLCLHEVVQCAMSAGRNATFITCLSLINLWVLCI